MTKKGKGTTWGLVALDVRLHLRCHLVWNLPRDQAARDLRMRHSRQDCLEALPREPPPHSHYLQRQPPNSGVKLDLHASSLPSPDGCTFMDNLRGGQKGCSA